LNHPGDSVRNIADQLELHARHRPTHPAVIQGDTVLDYHALDQAVRQRASRLMDLGISPGQIVGIALGDTVEHLLMLWAVARAGAVILPMDCRWSAAEKSRLVEHFAPACVMVESGTAFAGARCLEVDSAWIGSLSETSIDRVFPDGDRGLVLSLSSGTTGRPKGPLMSHRKFMSRFWTHWVDLGFGSREIYLNATPLYFGGGRSFSMSTHYVGGTVVLFPPPYGPSDLAAEVVRTRASVLFLVPTLLRRLLASDDLESGPFQSLKVLISSGSALSAEERPQIRERLCANFVEFYSSTEGGGITVLGPHDQDEHPGSVGRAVFGVSVQVVDGLHQVLPTGSVGRIRYQGAAVADAFFQDPEASAEAFHEGWFYPGDLGCLDEEGFLYLKGRAKDMIIRGGINIYPQEVEAVLLAADPAVVDVAVVGWPSAEFNEEVAAFVVARGPLDTGALRRHCTGQLAPYKVPREIFIVDDLPRNSLGKVVKAELTARLPRL
jgi:acyl-CoA synthetase (AMP-forming)/AMP-acid ligase II